MHKFKCRLHRVSVPPQTCIKNRRKNNENLKVDKFNIIYENL